MARMELWPTAGLALCSKTLVRQRYMGLEDVTTPVIGITFGAFIEEGQTFCSPMAA